MRDANIRNEWHKIKEKWFSFVVFEHTTSASYSHFMFGSRSTSTKDSKTIQLLLCLLYQHQGKNIIEIFSKYNNYRIIITMYRILNSIFLRLLHSKKISHSAGKMHSYKKIFPHLVDISVSYRRDLG